MVCLMQVEAIGELQLRQAEAYPQQERRVRVSMLIASDTGA